MDKNPNVFIKLVKGGDISIDKELDPCNTPIGSSRYQFGTTGTNSDTGRTDFDEYFRNPSSILSLQPWIFKREKQNLNSNPNFSEKAEPSTNYKSCIRTKRGQNRNLIKPISIENSLIPQLFNEDFKFEEHVFGEIKTRPFIVTDGIKVLNKNPEFEISSKNSDFLREKELNEVRKGKRKSLDLRENGNLRSTKHSNSQAHSPSYPAGESTNNKNNNDNNPNSDNNNNNKNSGKIFVLSIGICIGVLSSILSNKKEFEKLNDKLKSSENLIQDLQEELEMKDSLTVKELLPLEPEPDPEPSRSFLQEDNSQSMSKIEAELEAELEMLELNITSSSLQGRPPVFDEEINEELDGEIVKGELKAETFNYKNDDISDDYDNHNDDISDENHWTGPVSPRQLSIRLHELLQDRHEERIKELETQLAQSQRQIQILETEFSERTLSNSDLDSGPLNNNADPFCLNLSGEALNAYQEAFKEFEKEKDNDNNNNDINIDISDYNYDYGNIDEYDENEESDDDCDEIIKKIVEKNREGSPVIRHAQMMLLSLDDLN
ncbi:hypothetical protein LUZ60_009197 [Juncus effusus]|nr:hypothetical protein LUZ60_009197 [Juncus effusus]